MTAFTAHLVPASLCRRSLFRGRCGAAGRAGHLTDLHGEHENLGLEVDPCQQAEDRGEGAVDLPRGREVGDQLRSDDLQTHEADGRDAGGHGQVARGHDVRCHEAQHREEQDGCSGKHEGQQQQAKCGRRRHGGHCC